MRTKRDNKIQTQCVNQFDLAFVVDTTGSMGGFLSEARQDMLKTIDKVAKTHLVDFQFGLIEYRDHPPQDRLLTKTYRFTNDQKTIEQTIHDLYSDGGGDGPEAVLDGLIACCKLTWRKNARRLAVLIGDAPPHGTGGSGDAFPDGCPCKQTINSTCYALEEQSITLYGLALTDECSDSFSRLSAITGGKCFDAPRHGNAIFQIGKILEDEFSNLELDVKVMSLFNDGMTSASEIADKTESSLREITRSMGRLGSRELLIYRVL